MSARNFNLFEPKKYGNVRVIDKAVYLHGYNIAQWNDEYVTLNAHNWFTQTTKRAMNNVLKQLKLNYHIYQKNFNWYILDLQNGHVVNFSSGVNVIYFNQITKKSIQERLYKLGQVK